MIPDGLVGLSLYCLSCTQVLFAAVLVHSVPPGSHLWSASTQVSAAAICCSGQVLQSSVIEPCSFTFVLFQALEVSVSSGCFFYDR